jgi:DNA-binding NarL/FixJ family response regulator
MAEPMRPPKSKLVRILMVDDHPLMRATLAEIFDAQQDLEVVGQAGDGEQAVQLARALSPDVIVMDIYMPRLSGLEATRRIIAHSPACHVLMVTSGRLEDHRRDAQEAGALGLVAKGSSSAELVGAVRAVSKGKSLLSSAPP